MVCSPREERRCLTVVQLEYWERQEESGCSRHLVENKQQIEGKVKWFEYAEAILFCRTYLIRWRTPLELECHHLWGDEIDWSSWDETAMPATTRKSGQKQESNTSYGQKYWDRATSIYGIFPTSFLLKWKFTANIPDRNVYLYSANTRFFQGTS